MRLEVDVGVPGSVGGGVRMNAGGHGSDMAACLVRVRVFDLATGDDCVVQAADLGLEIAETVRWRRDNQPGGQNAGSVFTNPPGDSAGRLVDAAGCKGLRLGTAEVSTEHANFIQADPGGSADDVLGLIREVQRRVHAAFGIDLEPELRLLGFDG